MENAVLDILPSAKKAVTIDQCFDGLESFAGSTFYQYSCLPAQAKADMCREVIADFARGKQPRLAKLQDTAFMRQVHDRLQHFVRYDLPSETAGGAAVLTGKEALQRKLEPIWAAHGEGKPAPALSQLDEFQLFSFLLTAAQLQQVQFMTDAAVEAQQASASSSTCGPRKRAIKNVSDGKTKSTKCAQAKSQAKKVMEMFD